MSYRLVADVGGTNSRLAICHDGAILLDTRKTYTNANWDSLYIIIEDYLKSEQMLAGKISDAQITEMVVGVAGPVQGASAMLTNHKWHIEVDVLKTKFECENVCLLNDLSALGYATGALKDAGLKPVHGAVPSHQNIEQSLVVGVGTGCNVSPVLKKGDGLFCSIAEAGHVGMPQSIRDELLRLGLDRSDFPTVEHLFSGRGFTAFCRKMAKDDTLEGKGVILVYGTPEAANISAIVDEYAVLLGHLLREMYLSYMPSHGIYLAGSVARAVIEKAPQKCLDVVLEPSKFYQSHNVPVWVIEEDSAALFGCANYSNF
ncbi:MAG: glucokinase [Nitratireductor sp.]